MRPGITGLWQTSARGDMDFKLRVALDCEYVQNFTLSNDFRYVLKTILVVLRRDGAY
jgi:lipopolysaccharide/colanic/teichoic acid biosynthesis glycosyltransferase